MVPFPFGTSGHGPVAAASLPIGGADWRKRIDGFTPARRRTFLVTLAKTGCVRDGARVAGVSTTTVDRWRARDPVFAAACETALHMAASDLEMLAWERAVTGIAEPVWAYGRQVGVRIKRSDAIFRLLLIGANAKKYGRMGAAGRKALVKAERKRIEAEVRAQIAAEARDPDEVLAEIKDKLRAIRARQRQSEAGGLPADRDGDPDGDAEPGR